MTDTLDTTTKSLTRTDRRVNGHAAEGDLVSYFDIANQSGRTYLVAGVQTNEWGSEFVLQPVDENGDVDLDTKTETSDCRQYGWAFVEWLSDYDKAVRYVATKVNVDPAEDYSRRVLPERLAASYGEEVAEKIWADAVAYAASIA